MADCTRNDPGTLREAHAILCGPESAARWDAQASFVAAKERLILAEMRASGGTPFPDDDLDALRVSCQAAWRAMCAAEGQDRPLPAWLRGV